MFAGVRQSLRNWLRDRRVREVFLWCLPALILGTVLRTALMVSLPYGYCTVDTPDFLGTPYKLIYKHQFRIHGKKTFLQPIVYSIPFFIGIPALIFIPVLQHLCGLVAILLIGGICRFWFYQWKWFIIPLTLVMAAHPSVLWYEHTLMAEALYMFCIVLLVFSATVFALRKSWHAFAFLCVALFLTAGSRPEGKLMFGFGIALVVITLWRERQMFGRALLIIVVLAVGTNFVTRTDQAGLLLYTSVAYLTPAHLKIAPGFENYIAPVQQRLDAAWNQFPTFGRVKERKEIAAAVNAYFQDHPGTGKVNRDQDVNHFCKKLAYETCLRALPNLPVLAYYKFRNSAADSTTTGFGQYWLVDRQLDAFVGGKAPTDAHSMDELPADETKLSSDLQLTRALSKRLIGHKLQTREEVEQWVRNHYVAARVGWYQKLHYWWEGLGESHDAWRGVYTWRLPDWHFHGTVLFGIPYFFLIALLGMITVAFRRGQLQPMQILWTLNILALFFIIMLTANVKSRFRFVFEPFWYLYILLLVDSVVYFVRRLMRRGRAPEPGDAAVSARA